MARNSKVILAKGINLDNTYSNVLNYTENEMLTLLRSNDHLMYNGENYSFIRENENQISVQVPYDVCLQSNYLAFQNTDYSNKWFFCFIKDIKYTSDKTTTITYDVDVFSTWFNSITVKPVFIEREHVNDDTPGIHTVPEGLETGDYIGSDVDSLEGVGNEYIIFQVINETTPNPSDPWESVPTRYGGIYSGCEYMIFDLANAGRFIKYMDEEGKKDYIINIFMYKGKLTEGTSYYITKEGSIVCQYTELQTSTNAEFETDLLLYDSKPSQVGYYQPVNKKLLTFPYCYILANNNAGTSKIYKYEDFDTTDIKFAKISTVCPGGSSIYYPMGYKMGRNYSSVINYNEGFVGAKFPVCSWTSDGYINWLTQSSVNREDTFKKDAGSILTAVGATALGAATGSPTITMFGVSSLTQSVGGTVGDIMNNVKAKKEHQIAPLELAGNANAGDVIFAHFRSLPQFTQMFIKEEYARIIDNFFTRFGYQINRVKTPNITGRRYWNYVKIGATEDIGNGDIPNKFKDSLNQIFKNGTTIWHSHDNIGNFNLNNTII